MKAKAPSITHLKVDKRLDSLPTRSKSQVHLNRETEAHVSLPKLVTYGQAGRNSLLSFLSGVMKPVDVGDLGSPSKNKAGLVKVIKLFLTMDEAMIQGASRERDMIVEPETKLKEEDPLRILLYDTNTHNRKRAAKIIARHIENEVRGKRLAADDESSVELDSSEDEPEEVKSIIPSLSLKEFKDRLQGCNSLKDKLDKIDSLTGEHYSSLRQTKVNTTEDGSKEVGRTTTFDESSSQLRQNKSTERMRRLDSRLSIDPSELFYHSVKQRTIKFNTKMIPSEYVGSLSVKGLKEILARLAKSDLQQIFFDIVTKSQTFKLRNERANVLLNFTNMSLPESDINKIECLYITTRFAHFSILKELNLAGNTKIGDIVGYALVKVLVRYTEELEILNLAQTKLGLKTSEAVAELLAKPRSKLKNLNLERNMIDERGFLALIEALSFNSTVEILNLSYNPIAAAGALLINRMIRSNKSIKCLRLNGLPLTGQPIHGISRSMIVNTVIKSVFFNDDGLTDADVKEICFSLTVNRSLNLISLADNYITKEGLKPLAQLMARNISLYHIGLSGNTEIKIEHLDAFKESLPSNRDLEILKQEDLLTLQLLISKGLARYL